MPKKIVIITSSPRTKSYSTYLAKRVQKNLQENHHIVTTIDLNKMDLQVCVACDSCRKENSNFCVLKDDMKNIYPVIIESDAVLLASPIYWFSVNAKMKLLIDRFYAFYTEKTKALRNKTFGIILSYGDIDLYVSGAINAIRMFEDSFKYTGSKLCKILYATEVPDNERGENKLIENEIETMSKELVK
jgi:multimeric flavodoxin WrbA